MFLPDCQDNGRKGEGDSACGQVEHTNGLTRQVLRGARPERPHPILVNSGPPVPPRAEAPAGLPLNTEMTTRTELPAFMTVGQAADRLGVAPSTLRTWERRYGLAPGGRSSGGHRRYRPQDLAVLQVMRDLVVAGERPARAAERAIAAASAVTDDSLDLPLGVDPYGHPGAGKPSLRAAAARADDGALDGVVLAGSAGLAGEGTTQTADAAGVPGHAPAAEYDERLSIPDASQPVRRLAAAAVALDVDACVRLVGRTLTLDGVELTWDHVLRPVLTAAGAYWARTGGGVEVEHLLTGACIEALTAYRRDCPRPEARPPVLLACAPGDQHSLPLHVLAAALAERRVPSRVLGAAVPGPAIIAAAQRTQARAVFVWAQLPDPRHATVLADLSVCRPALRVVLGGPGWDGVNLPLRVTRSPGLGDAARALAPDLLARPATSTARPRP